MSDLRLFRLNDNTVEPIIGTAVALEKSLQTLIERHAETLLGVRVLASEYATTKSHGGRIDTLGIDESGSPVIVEYKRAQNENVINQGLFYLNWLLDHQADFTLLVLKKLGAEAVETIDWSGPRLICIAGDFTKYDQHAIQQMPRNIDLVRYRRYGDDLLLLEQFASSAVEVPNPKAVAKPMPTPPAPPSNAKKPGAFTGTGGRPRVLDLHDQCSTQLQDCYGMLRAYSLGLGDGIHEHFRDQYIAFRGLKNFAYVRFRPTLGKIKVEVNVDDATLAEETGFLRPAVGQGHSPEFDIVSSEDVERALPLIAQSYRRT